MRDPVVYAVTVSHNRRCSTRNFFESLKSQTYRNFVLVLVDDGSTDGTAELVEHYDFRKEICHGDGNLWWAGGIRRGLARVKALSPAPHDVVLIANDDTTFEADFLAKGVMEMRELGRGAMLCASVRFIDSNGWNEGGIVSYWPRFTTKHYGRHPERIDCANTRCILMSFSDLAVSGTFRPRLLPQYLSDYEFTIRARRRGIKLVPARSLVCNATEYTTGSHGLVPGSFLAVTKQMLSPRFSANPRSLFMYILMATPWFWKPVCWFWALRTTFSFFVRATIADRLRGR